MILPYGLATTPVDVGRGRRCGIWISPFLQDHAVVIVDTAALTEGQRQFSGPDTFPTDAVLVVVNAVTASHLAKTAEALPYPTSGPHVAAALITQACTQEIDLALRIGWCP